MALTEGPTTNPQTVANRLLGGSSLLAVERQRLGDLAIASLPLEALGGLSCCLLDALACLQLLTGDPRFLVEASEDLHHGPREGAIVQLEKLVVLAWHEGSLSNGPVNYPETPDAPLRTGRLERPIQVMATCPAV